MLSIDARNGFMLNVQTANHAMRPRTHSESHPSVPSRSHYRLYPISGSIGLDESLSGDSTRVV